MHKIERLIPDQELEPFYQGLDKFCDEYLETSAEEEFGPKIFADPLEGYANLASWEVALVDTPLFQRLRGIRQLGLAYLVYPTLGYSRFEHTIGVLARLKQVIGHIKANLAERGGPSNLPDLPSDKQFVTVRLAALCHDIGHSVFSHVSEGVMAKLSGSPAYPSAAKISAVFTNYGGRAIPMAEILAVCIVTTPAFIRFLQHQGVPHASKSASAHELAHGVAHIIMGLPIPNDPHSLFLAQLMSSGLDVDKLDYMLRESHLSGISLGISLEWLFKKLLIIDLPADQVPDGLHSRIRKFSPKSHFAVLSLARAGQFAFEEFCIARLTLHEKIYLHQKIRAAEAYLAGRLQTLPTQTPEFIELHRWLFLRESLFEHPCVELPTLPASEEGMMKALFQDERKTTRNLNLNNLLTKRQLLFRAYCFGWQNAIAEPVTERHALDESGTDKLMKLIHEKPQELLRKIQQRLAEIRAVLRADEPIPEGDPEVIVDPPRLSSIQQGHDTLYFEHPSRMALRWTMPIDRIVEYYHDNRALGYVFSTKQHLAQVLLAAERAAWDLFQVVYVQEGLLNSRVVDQANKLKIILHAKGFYSDARVLQPVSDFLNTLDAQTLISKVARKLALYESRTRKRVTPASTTTFAAQFPPHLQEAALDWLQAIEWIQPDDEIREAFRKVVRHKLFDRTRTVGLCPIGAMTDSASHIAYKLREMDKEFFPDRTIMIMPLNEALARKLDAYVFYDDNVNSGLQSLNIFATWLGATLDNKLALAEKHVQPLESSLQEELRKKPIAMTFAVGTEGAKERLMGYMETHLHLERQNILCEVNKSLSKNERVFNGTESGFQHKDKIALRDFVRDVATTILLSEKQSQDAVNAKALGYAEAEAMVVFPYNCPTMTVTALWISGIYQGAEWLPLIARGRRTDPATGAPVGEDA